jgi:hypothetical protein
MLLDLKSLSNTSLNVKEDFRNGFCLGLNRRHQWWMIQIPYHHHYNFDFFEISKKNRVVQKKLFKKNKQRFNEF